ENGGEFGGELKGIAVAAGNKHGAAALFLLGGSRGKKIIGLETGCLRVLKTACCDKLRQHIQLLDQCLIEFASALVGGKRFMAVRLCLQRVPPDKHGARLLLAVKTQQHIGKAEDRAR